MLLYKIQVLDYCADAYFLVYRDENNTKPPIIPLSVLLPLAGGFTTFS